MRWLFAASAIAGLIAAALTTQWNVSVMLCSRAAAATSLAE